jgi:hypothetical protein
MPRSATEESSTPARATEAPPAQITIRAPEIAEEEERLARGKRVRGARDSGHAAGSAAARDPSAGGVREAKQLVQAREGLVSLTAADMAAFMWNLDKAVPADKRDFGLSVLGDIVEQQSWAIPAAAGPHWDIRFRGGWRSTVLGQLVHQAAALRHEDGFRTAIAVLTDAQPTQTYGIESVRGVAERVLDHANAHRGSSRPNHSE